MKDNEVKIIILTYHRVIKKEDIEKIKEPQNRIYTIDIKKFDKHCDYLKKNNFKTLQLSELINNISGYQRYKNKKNIILTFDDGYEDNYNIVYPILKKYGMIATFFITTGNIGKKGFIQSNQLKEMVENGMEIQSHTHTHPNLEKIDDVQLRDELKRSKDILHKIINKDVFILALPYGTGKYRIKKNAIETGYKLICTSEWGVNYFNEKTLLLKRFSIKCNDSYKKFQSFVGEKKTLLLLIYQTKNKIMNIARNILGKEKYDILRKFILKYIN